MEHGHPPAPLTYSVSLNRLTEDVAFMGNLTETSQAFLKTLEPNVVKGEAVERAHLQKRTALKEAVHTLKNDSTVFFSFFDAHIGMNRG